MILGHVANMSSELVVTRLARTTSHFMGKLFERLGTEGRVSTDALTKGLPSIFFAYRSQRGIRKKTKETKAKSVKKDEWF